MKLHTEIRFLGHLGNVEELQMAGFSIVAIVHHLQLRRAPTEEFPVTLD